MGSPYRRKQLTYDNQPEGQREVYSFGIGAAGAVTTVRPSAGNSATAGQGNLATISHLATGVYQVVFTQTYLKSNGAVAVLRSPFGTDGSTRQNLDVQVTLYDSASNSVCIFVQNNATGALTDPSSGSAITIEKFWIESVSPSTL